MSTISTDAEFKKPKQPRTSIANRDRPLFAGHRPSPRFQQRPDFFTDSLNTSYIPSPSPPKKNVRQGAGAKPRQATLNGRSLATAFKATQGSRQGDRPSSSASSTHPERRQEQGLGRKSNTEQKPSIERKSTRDHSIRATTKPVSSNGSARTPSPDRGRQQELLRSPASEASASSPPRGLAEAYQRIQDEEFLAGREDDSIDDPEFEDELVEVQPLDSQRNQLHEVKGPESPISADESDMDFPNKGREDGIMYNSDGDTNISFAANLGDDTFDRLLTQYDKDEQRLRNVLASDRQPFKKSRTRDKSGLTLDNLRRQDAGSKSGSSTLGSPSVSSKGSDPSLNIPPGWGRKGRGNNTWLSRIGGQSGKFTGDVSNSRSLQTPPKLEEKHSTSPVVDWLAAAAEVPLPSVENESLQSHFKSRGSTPASLTRPSQLQRQSSSDRIRRWEFLDDDFTARSLQASDSPPIRIRNAALDAIREREIHNLEKSAVTTNRLGELREKKSLEQVRRRSPSASAGAGTEGRQVDDALGSTRAVSSQHGLYKSPTKEEEPEILHEEPLLEDVNGEPLLDSPVVITRVSPEPLPTPIDTTKLDESMEGHSSDRPKHERVDSRDLLRKLARATSVSPRQSPVTSGIGEVLSHNAGASGRDGGEPGESDVSCGKVPELIEGSHSDHTEVQFIDRATAPTICPPVPSTPQQSKPTDYLKTPLVMGAWIETPLPTGTRGLPMPTPNEIEDEDENQFDLDVDAGLIKRGAEDTARHSRSTVEPEIPKQLSLAETAPLLPKSALAAIIEKAKSNKRIANEEGDENVDDTLLLDDSTIQSLEELLASDTEAPAIATSRLSSSTFPWSNPHHKPVTPPAADEPPPEEAVDENPREQEAQSYDRITKRLSQVGLSIRDAKKGIASLERAVSAAPAKASAASEPPRGECVEGGEFHDFIWPCERCGCPGRGEYSEDGFMDWQTVRMPVPRLWTWQKEDWRPRLTWLGVITAAAWALVGAEWIAQ